MHPMNTKKLLPLTVLAFALPFAACGGGGTEATTTAPKAPATAKVEQAEPVKAEPIAKPKPKKVKHLPALARQIKPEFIKLMQDGTSAPIKVKSLDCTKQSATTAKCIVAMTGDETDADGSLHVVRGEIATSLDGDWKFTKVL
jgi:hypothetical protein